MIDPALQLRYDIVANVDNRPLLSSAYDAFMRWLLDQDTWSLQNETFSRFGWKDASSARNAFRPMFDRPGVYVFGSGACPLYWGRTSRQTLWRRLSARYVQGEYSQCQLAVIYQKDLLARGIEGFPVEVRNWYRRRFRGSTTSLRHAVAFSLAGPETIWFSIIPTETGSEATRVEKDLISVAGEWNSKNSCPPLLNSQLSGR